MFFYCCFDAALTQVLNGNKVHALFSLENGCILFEYTKYSFVSLELVMEVVLIQNYFLQTLLTTAIREVNNYTFHSIWK